MTLTSFSSLNLPDSHKLNLWMDYNNGCRRARKSGDAVTLYLTEFQLEDGSTLEPISFMLNFGTYQRLPGHERILYEVHEPDSNRVNRQGRASGDYCSVKRPDSITDERVLDTGPCKPPQWKKQG